MRLLRLAAAAAVLLLVGRTAAVADGAFALKKGDTVVFYGDSITEQRLYPGFTETYVLTRFPTLGATFFDKGVGGDRVSGGWAGPVDVRIERDVLPLKPTVMTCMLGMNDGSYRAYDPAIFATYANGYRHILDKVTAALPRVRITLIQPSPYDDVTRAPGFPGGYNGVLLAYSQFVSNLAHERHQNTADLNDPVVATLVRAIVADKELAAKIVPDRVHPGPGGHLIMAEALLKSWNAPSTVTSVEIDAPSVRVARAENTAVSGLTTNGGALRWSQSDKALPFPLDARDPALMLAVASSDFVQALDQQPLKVTGLTAARYALRIDGEQVGSFTSQELAAGVNLAVLDTPMARQAASVHALTMRHTDQNRKHWEQGQARWTKMSAAERAAFVAIGPDEAQTIKEQRAAAQPKPHTYDLTPE